MASGSGFTADEVLQLEVNLLMKVTMSLFRSAEVILLTVTMLSRYILMIYWLLRYYFMNVMFRSQQNEIQYCAMTTMKVAIFPLLCDCLLLHTVR